MLFPYTNYNLLAKVGHSLQKNKATEHKCSFFYISLYVDSSVVLWKPTKGYTNC